MSYFLIYASFEAVMILEKADFSIFPNCPFAKACAINPKCISAFLPVKILKQQIIS